MSVILNIANNIFSWFKNLTFQEGIIVLLVMVTAGSVFAANGYRNESIQLQTVLATAKTIAEIERDNAKLKDNAEELERLRSKLEKKDDTIVYLFRELDKVKSVPNTRTQVMEEIGDLNDTEDICGAFAKFGYDICGDFSVQGR